MLNAIFDFILNAFFWLLGLIGSIIIYPIQLLVVSIFPGLGSYVSLILTFFNENIFPMVSFAKELFLDLSCLPRPLFSIFITFIFAKWTLAPAVRSFKLIMNLWKMKGGNKTN